MLLFSQGALKDFGSEGDPEQLTNSELMQRCSALGNMAVKSRRMFVGLLPLVERRCAYDVKKFSSIYYFASVVGGVGYDIVSEVLRLDAQLSNMPLLRRAMYLGEIGWSKIRAVVSLVTVENQERWLGLLRSLSRSALLVYVRDMRRQENEVRGNLFTECVIEVDCESENSMLQSSFPSRTAKNEAESFAGEITPSENGISVSQPLSKLEQLSQQRETFSFPVNSWVVAQLRLFRQQLERKTKQMVTWEQVMVALLAYKSG